MTKKNTAKSAAAAAVAAALASALSLGTAAPALAEPALPPDPAGEAALVAQSYVMTEGEAVWYARAYLGMAASDVEDVDAELTWYAGTLCYEVELETWYSDAEYHVVLDAYNGTVYASWVEW